MSESEHDTGEQVRRRAYELWEAAGRPEGRGDEFWHEACADVASNVTTVATATVEKDPSRA